MQRMRELLRASASTSRSGPHNTTGQDELGQRNVAVQTFSSSLEQIRYLYETASEAFRQTEEIESVVAGAEDRVRHHVTKLFEEKLCALQKKYDRRIERLQKEHQKELQTIRNANEARLANMQAQLSRRPSFAPLSAQSPQNESAATTKLDGAARFAEPDHDLEEKVRRDSRIHRVLSNHSSASESRPPSSQTKPSSQHTHVRNEQTAAGQQQQGAGPKPGKPNASAAPGGGAEFRARRLRELCRWQDSELRKLTGTVQALRKEAERISKLEHEIDRKETQNDRLQSVVDQLDQELESLRNEKAELESSIVSLRHQQKEESAAHNEQINSFKDHISTAKRQCDAALRAMELSFAKEREHLLAEVQRAEELASAAEISRTRQEGQLQKLEAQIEELKSKLHVARTHQHHREKGTWAMTTTERFVLPGGATLVERSVAAPIGSSAPIIKKNGLFGFANDAIPSQPTVNNKADQLRQETTSEGFVDSFLRASDLTVSDEAAAGTVSPRTFVQWIPQPHSTADRAKPTKVKPGHASADDPFLISTCR